MVWEDIPGNVNKRTSVAYGVLGRELGQIINLNKTNCVKARCIIHYTTFQRSTFFVWASSTDQSQCSSHEHGGETAKPLTSSKWLCLRVRLYMPNYIKHYRTLNITPLAPWLVCVSLQIWRACVWILVLIVKFLWVYLNILLTVKEATGVWIIR